MYHKAYLIDKNARSVSTRSERLVGHDWIGSCRFILIDASALIHGK